MSPHGIPSVSLAADMSELRLELSKFKAPRADLERRGDFDPQMGCWWDVGVFGISCSSVLHGVIINFHGF